MFLFIFKCPEHRQMQTHTQTHTNTQHHHWDEFKYSHFSIKHTLYNNLFHCLFVSLHCILSEIAVQQLLLLVAWNYKRRKDSGAPFISTEECCSFSVKHMTSHHVFTTNSQMCKYTKQFLVRWLGEFKNQTLW